MSSREQVRLLIGFGAGLVLATVAAQCRRDAEEPKVGLDEQTTRSPILQTMAFMNMGGSVEQVSPSEVRVVYGSKQALLIESPRIAIAVPPITCRGSVKEPRIEASIAAVRVSVPLKPVRNVAYQAVFGRTVASEIFLRSLSGTDLIGQEARVVAKWNCSRENVPHEQVVAQLSTDPFDIDVINDPSGIADRPTGGSAPCGTLPHVSIPMELIEVVDWRTPAKCAAGSPATGWVWTLSPPSVPNATVRPVPTSTVIPPLNPMDTLVGGQYGWAAPTGQCYYVKATIGTCSYYSPVFAETITNMITDLNLRVDLPVPGSPCPVPNTCK